MERADKDLAFLLRYENVAWFEDGEVGSFPYSIRLFSYICVSALFLVSTKL